MRSLGRSRRQPGLQSLAAAAALALIVSACVTVDEAAGPAVGTPIPSGLTSSEPDAASSPPVGTVGPSLAATTSPPLSSAAPAASAPRPTVLAPSDVPSLGYLSLDESVPFVQRVSLGVREAAVAAGVELVECDPSWSRSRVTDCAAELALAGVHGLISFQPFADLTAEVCAATGSAPTVGVVFDQGACQVAQLRIDQAESGRLAGDAMGAFASERWDCQINSYISLESGDADPDGRARMQGYRDGFTAHCPLPEQEYTLDGADRLATAQTQVEDLIGDLKGRPNLVVGLNEDAILGAMAAASAADRANQFWYSGQLADPSIRQTIACDEHYVASVAQFPDRFGAPLVTTLLDVLEGREVSAFIDADLELVTAENVRQLFPDTTACDG